MREAFGSHLEQKAVYPDKVYPGFPQSFNAMIGYLKVKG